MPGKRLSKQEIMRIITLKQKGYSYREISKEVEKSRKTIESVCRRYRVVTNGLKPIGLPTIETDEGDIIGTITPISTVETPTIEVNVDDVIPAPSVSADAKPVFVETMTLKDYTDEQLIAELYERKYRIENGQLVQHVVRVVSFDRIAKA